MVAPWFIRQLSEFGSLFPSSDSGRILFIRDYGEMFSADGPLNLGYLLAWGVGPLLASRLVALFGIAPLLWAVYLAALALPPLVIWGGWAARSVAGLRPWIVWAGLFWLWSGLVAAPHLLTGNFIHSVAVILPLTLLLLVLGFEAAMTRIAQRLPRWDAAAGTRRFRFGLIALIVIVSGISTAKTIEAWAGQRDAYVQITAYLNAHGPADAPVMSADPGETWLVSGHPGIQSPTSGATIIESALRSYHVRWVVLDSNSIIPVFSDLMLGKSTYPFLSAKPVFVVPDPDPKALYPRLSIYAVLPPAP